MGAEDSLIRAPDNVRLHHVEIGTSPDWLIAPGVGNEVDFERLARRRTVAFFDLRNRGRSDPVPDGGQVGFPIEVDDIDTVRRHIGAGQVDLFGWSYVGLVAALYAARYPHHVRRLVLSCPAPVRHRSPPPETEADRRVLDQIADLQQSGLDESDPVGFAREWRRITVPTRMGDPAAFHRLRSDPSPWPNEWPDHMTTALRRVAATQPPDFDHRDEVRQISAPTLILGGEVDRYPSLEAIHEWADTIPGSRLVVLPGVGHYPQAEAPGRFFEAIDAFLAL